MSSESCDIRQLAKLLQSPNNNRDEDHSNEEKSAPNTISSSHPQTSNKSNQTNNPYAKINTTFNQNQVQYDEFGSVDITAQSSWKNRPEFTITYRQSVTAEDMFLGVGGKTPSTASCEHMIVTIGLPNEKYQNIDLTLQKTVLQLETSRFLLDLPLPQAIDPKKAHAQWDPSKSELTLTLRMDREFDFLNF